MNGRQYFLTTSLSYQLKAAQQELSSFRSGDAYTRLRAEYESIIRDLNHTIKKLQKERDDISFSRKEITRQWMDAVLLQSLLMKDFNMQHWNYADLRICRLLKCFRRLKMSWDKRLN